MDFFNTKGEKTDGPKEYGWRPAVYGVLIENDKLLFIKPNWDDRYSLPGGSMQHGEDLRESLKREFLEETGYEIATEANPFFVDSELFGDREKDKFFQRISIYYRVKRLSDGQKGDIDEESEEIIWKNINDLKAEDFTFFQRGVMESILG